MSSNPIMFDSEEFDYQVEDKENKTSNEITSVPSVKETPESIQGDLLNQLLELEAQTKKADQSQSSQDVLDTITTNIIENTSNNQEESQTSQDILDRITSNVSNKPSNTDTTSNTSNIVKHSNSMNSEMPNTLPHTQNVGNHDEPDSELNVSEPMDDSEVMEAESSVLANDTQANDADATTSKKPSSHKHSTLPLSRVKLIMKTDPNVKVVSLDATILAAMAAEKFLQFIVQETLRITKSKKKKTMLKQHFDEAIQGLEVTEFLEGMMDDDL